MTLLPGLGEVEAPAMLRLGLAMALAALILPGVGQISTVDGWHTAAMVLAELAYGGWLGGLARLFTLALPMAGQIISFMFGLSSVVQPDPALGQSSALMRLFSVVAPLLVLNTGLWAYPVAALSASYSIAPPGTMLPISDGVQAVTAAIAGSLALAMQLAAPFVFASIIWQLALGLFSRMVPHLQVYYAAMPAQIVGGLLLLGLLSTGLMTQWVDATRLGFSTLPGL